MKKRATNTMTGTAMNHWRLSEVIPDIVWRSLFLAIYAYLELRCSTSAGAFSHIHGFTQPDTLSFKYLVPGSGGPERASVLRCLDDTRHHDGLRTTKIVASHEV